MKKIFLYGPPGSGKSTVGKILAENLNVRFVDVDREIEVQEAKTVSAIINEYGLEYFRDLETKAIRSVCEGGENVVVALGGGALLREENRARCEACGDIVFLETDYSCLVARLKKEANSRPLLTGRLEAQLKTLLEQREGHYSSFMLRVATQGKEISDSPQKTPDDIAGEIRQLSGWQHVRGMGKGYDVVVEEGALANLGQYLGNAGITRSLAVVMDENVASYYADMVRDALDRDNMAAQTIIIPAGESYKTLDIIRSIWSGFISGNLDRKSTVIGLGGGVVGDLTGFAASTYMRGCNWVAIPTTVLSMVDASIGGKTGFDLPEGKNLIGAFYPPRQVLADPLLLVTLPDEELRSGIAEVVKHGVIGDVELFEICSQGLSYIKENLTGIIRRAISVKIRIVQEDPLETGVRASLNLGHTIGHAIELASGYQIRHGEAVSIGMVQEAKLAENLGIAGKGLADRIAETLVRIGLPVDLPEELDKKAILEAMRMDKKKENKVIKFALPVEIGKVRVGVAVEELEKAL